MKLERVLVVGAGLAGALIAREMRKRGAAVDIVERRVSFTPADGTGLLLTANGIGVLKSLGLGSVMSIANKIEHICFRDQPGKLIGTVQCRKDVGAPFLGVRYARMRELILGDIQIKHGLTVDSIFSDSETIVRFSNGVKQAYDLVVGADGIFSNVRRLLFGSGHLVTLSGYSGYRFVTRLNVKLSDAQIYLGNGASFLLIPLDGGEVYCAAGPISPDVWEEGSDDRDTICRSFADFGIEVAQVLGSLDRHTRFVPTKYGFVKLPNWVHGNCVLIGDAAHAMPPTLSQGASLAFEDVYILLDCLDQNSCIAEGLIEFDGRRRERVEELQALSIERMSANQLTAHHTYRTRMMATAAFGISDTAVTWARLTDSYS